MAPLPGSPVVTDTMHPVSSNTLAAPVDWSEFHVWNFRVQDAEKLKQRREKMESGTNRVVLPVPETDLKNGKTSGIKPLAVATSALVSASSSTRQQIHQYFEKQWRAWSLINPRSPISSQAHSPHKGAVYTAYAQFASGAIGLSSYCYFFQV